jgi:polyisoprenoid-binding protein YceI
MKLLRDAAVAALLLMSFATSASAAAETYALDPSHTVVGFSVRHFFSQVPGSFKEFSGTVKLDPSNWDASSVDATIQTASIFTNNDRRDNHLRSADFFEVDKYPTITFKSTKVTKSGDNKLQVAGDLTMKGVTKPVVLDVEFLGAGSVTVEGRAAGQRAGFSATTKINRKDFNILWNKNLDQGGTMLGDDVTINIGVEAIKQEAQATSASPAQAAPKADEKKATADKK